MPTLNTNLLYPFLLIFATGKKTCENMGRNIERSGDTISRALPTSQQSLAETKEICKTIFAKKKSIKVLVDDTILRKMFARQIEGTWKLYDGVFGMCVNGFRLCVVMISCGKIAFPWECKIILPKELTSDRDETKNQVIQRIYIDIQENFPNAEITMVADGAFATVAMLDWCKIVSARATMRMHRNRRVFYKGESVKISEIKNFVPQSWRTARTIQVLWHGHTVFITAEKRMDKHGEITVVYIVSTYKAKPAVHVKIYKQRWAIEKFFRTSKQILGLQDCASTRFEKHCNHVASVLLAYSIAQLERIRFRYNNVETAVRALRKDFFDNSCTRLSALNQILQVVANCA